MNYVQPGTPSERLIYASRTVASNAINIRTFCGHKHDSLLELANKRILKIKGFIDSGLSVSMIQGLQDEGIDILIEFVDGSRAGIQIKSPFDIDQSDFAQRTKAQIASADRYPKLEAYLIFLCPCPDLKGSIEKCRAFESFIAQRADQRVKVLPPEAAASFLFSENILDLSKIDSSYREVRRLSFEVTRSDVLLNDSLRFRYLLCRNLMEMRRLIHEGKRDHFPIPSLPTTVPTPALHFFTDYERSGFFQREVRVYESLGINWREAMQRAVDLLSEEGYEYLKSNRPKHDSSFLIDFPSAEGHPITERLISSDPLTRILLENGVPVDELVRVYAHYEECGGTEFQIIADSKEIEMVVLEVSAVSEPVNCLSLCLKHNIPPSAVHHNAQDDRSSWKSRDQVFQYPPKVLNRDECILIPLYLGLRPFNDGETIEIRSRGYEYSIATIGAERYPGAPDYLGGADERAGDPNGLIQPLGPVTEVQTIEFMSNKGYMESTPVRGLDRLNLLYLNEWLMVGSCPYVKVRLNDGSWQDLGTILDRCSNEPGWDEIILPQDWSGQLRIEEREDEVTYLTHVLIEYRGGSTKPHRTDLLGRRISPLRLKAGSVIEFFTSPASGTKTPVLMVKGFFVGAPTMSHELKPLNGQIRTFRLKRSGETFLI